MSKLYTKTFMMPNGRRKYVRAKTKEDLEQKVLELKMQMAAGIDISDNTRYDDFVRIWWTACAAPNMRETTQASAKIAINMSVAALGNMPVKDIKPMHINMMLKSWSNYSRDTKRRAMSFCKRIFQSAVDNGLIVKSPVPHDLRITGEKKQTEALTKDQQRRLLSAFEGHAGYPFVLLALCTGMRRGELCGLLWSDVDLAAGVIHVRHNQVLIDGKLVLNDFPKTDAGKRDIPIVPEVDRLLRSLPKTSIYVLTGPNGGMLNVNTVASWLRRVDLDFPVHPHLLRHTYCTNLIRAGLRPNEVQRLMGHASPMITMSIYTHYMAEDEFEDTKAKVMAAF